MNTITMSSRPPFYMSERVSESECGVASIRFYEASPLDSVRGQLRGENIQKGSRVAQMFVRGQMVMSDSPDEYRDHRAAIYIATGRILIHGLGLGCYLNAVLAKSEVTHVDVVEIEQDVIDLIEPYFEDDARVRFICADAFEQAKKWPRGMRWNCVWHDIWPDKCADNLPEYSILLRSFGRRCDWQGAWAHKEVKSL